MDNQERNREALVDHIAEQDRILRRRNEQIARQAKQIENQAQNAREAQQAIEEQAALIDTLRAENPRPLTADDITDEMVKRAAMMQYAQSRAPEPATRAQMWEWATESARMDYQALARQILTAALTEPPRPEGAEEIEGDLIDIIGTGVLNDSEFDTISIKLAERGYRKTGGKGAEELQALIRQAEAEGEGADNEALANYLAARLIDPTVKDQS